MGAGQLCKRAIDVSACEVERRDTHLFGFVCVAPSAMSCGHLQQAHVGL